MRIFQDYFHIESYFKQAYPSHWKDMSAKKQSTRLSFTQGVKASSKCVTYDMQVKLLGILYIEGT